MHTNVMLNLIFRDVQYLRNVVCATQKDRMIETTPYQIPTHHKKFFPLQNFQYPHFS